MRYTLRKLAMLTAVGVALGCCGSLAESEMPRVVDIPLSGEDARQEQAPVAADDGEAQAAPVAADDVEGQAAPMAADDGEGQAAPVAADDGEGQAAPVAADDGEGQAAPVAADDGEGHSAPVQANEAPEGQAASGEAAIQTREQMREAQQMLIDLGYLYGAADGIYGPMTASALKRFQADRRMEPTGELDDGTFETLSAICAQLGDVRALQQRLIDLGYLRGSADGAFGERSQAALRQFQAVHGLDITGMPDDGTREALFSEQAKSVPRGLGAGSKGDEVIALQEKLIQYGFLDAKADGVYGAKTSSSVKKFQEHLQAQGEAEALGIEANGEATPVTQLVLFDPEYTSYLRDIQAGEESSEVLRVERRLVALGYMDAEADETLDEYAVSAAEAFRASARIGGSGYDQVFFDTLFDTDAPIAEHFALHDISAGDKGVAVREVQQALVRCGMVTAMPDGFYGPDLSKAIGQLHDYLVSIGSPQSFFFEDDNHLSVEAQRLLTGRLLSRGSGVFTASDTFTTTRIQRRLHTLFYLRKGSIDGSFGEKTEEALRLFQKTNHLRETGTADTDTLERLFSEQAKCKQLPYRVEVSIADQRVYVYEPDQSGDYALTQTFVCSTGLGNSTPRGIFLEGGPCNVWHHFSKFDCWARYSYEIEGDIMFHSVLYSEKDTGTLREGSLYALGQKASHGCVRLAVKSAKWIFEHCKRGTVAIVIY